MNLKPFVFWDLFVFLFHHNKAKLLSAFVLSYFNREVERPRSLILAFACHLKQKSTILSYPLRAELRLLSDCNGMLADLSLR